MHLSPHSPTHHQRLFKLPHPESLKWWFRQYPCQNATTLAHRQGEISSKVLHGCSFPWKDSSVSCSPPMASSKIWRCPTRRSSFDTMWQPRHSSPTRLQRASRGELGFDGVGTSCSSTLMQNTVSDLLLESRRAFRLHLRSSQLHSSLWISANQNPRRQPKVTL
jgi:hypothetical protein